MSSAFEGLPKTPNLKLNKPGYDNVADIEALNENADILDNEIQDIKNTFVKSVNGINAGDGGNVDLGIMPIANGGTGQTTASGVRNALGLGNTTGAVPIANGGTGATTAANARTNLGLSTAVTGASISGKVITLTFADGTTKTLTTQDTGITPARYITEKYTSGTSWYEVYNDGWVRQGGRYTHTSATGYVTISLLKSFTNTNYSVHIQKGCPTADNFYVSNTPSARNWQASMYTTTSFKTFMSKQGAGEDSLAYCVWVAEGQGA